MYKPPVMIHPLSDVEPGCIIGIGTKIWRWSHIMSGSIIGENCVISQGCFVASTARIGNGVRIQNNVSVWDGVVIEDNCFVGPSVVFTNVKKPKAGRRGKFETTLVKEGVTIGANSVILCGITIGKDVIVGAGSVVTKDVPDGSMIWGVPAKVQHYSYHIRKVEDDDEEDNEDDQEQV